MKRCAIILALLLGGAVFCSAQSVELNGFVRLAGENWACFTRPNEPDQRGFMLGEGETGHGIKLVAVEFAKGIVVVEDQGERRTLRLRSATSEFSAFVPDTGLQTNGGLVSADRDERSKVDNVAGLDLGEQYQMMAGTPGWGTIPATTLHPSGAAAPAGGQGSATVSGSSTMSNPANTQTETTVATFVGTSSGSDPTQEQWYQESQNIEASRLETAKDVLTGDSTPLPRTPLTPPGTDPRLIGRETFYGSHIPHYITPGYLND